MENRDIDNKKTFEEDPVYVREAESFQDGKVGRKKHLFWKFFALIAGLGMLILGIAELATENALGIMPILIGCGLLSLGLVLIITHYKK